MEGHILVAQSEGHHLVKMLGDVRLTLAISFDRFIKDMFGSDFKSVTFDLREASAVDSTTLGLMAKIALGAKNFGHVPVVLVASTSIIRILDVMGFAELMTISNDEADSAFSGVDGVSSLAPIDGSEEEVKEKVLDAHKTLIKMSQANELKFKELIESLERNK